jgi:hypothetical protein
VPTIHSRPAKKSAKRATFIARAGDRRLKIILYSKSLLLKTIEDTGSIDMALRSLLWGDYIEYIGGKLFHIKVKPKSHFET